MSDNWVVQNLENALEVWNGKLSEIWQLITQSPQDFKGGAIWAVIADIHGALQAIGYALLVLFFVVGVVKTCGSFVEVKKPEHALKLFVRFVLAKALITYGMELMLAVFNICGGIIGTVVGGMGGAVSEVSALPGEIVTAIEDVTILQSIPLWLVSVSGSLIITVLSFILILTVYGRFFRLYLYTALAPIPLAAFAGEGTSAAGKAFLKSYTGVCMEGAVIVLSCLIYSAFLSSSTPAADTTLPAVTMVWQYVGQLVFNMLILTGLVKGADRIVKEMLGL